MTKYIKFTDFSFLLIILLSLFFYFNLYTLNVDSLWTIYVSEQMLQGKTLYKDLIEVNPPLKFIYTLIPVYIANIFSISKIFCFVLFISILIVTSTLISYKVIKYTDFEERKKRYILLSIILILTIISLTEYGEKEHLFIIFVFPYILLSIFREQINFKKNIILIAVVFASFGLNLKPHFLLIVLIIEVFLMIKKRELLYFFRWDFFLIILISIFYLVIIYIQFPEYLNFIVPFALKNYSYFNNQHLIVLLYNFEILFFILFLYFAFMFNKQILKIQEVKLLVFLALGLLLIYLLQQKGWYYQRLPYFSIVIFLCFYTLIKFYDKKIFYFVFVLILIFIKVYEFQQYQYTPKNLISILQNYPKDTKVHIYSSDIAKGQPIVTANNQVWASRFNALYFISSMQRANNKESEEYVVKSIYEDLNKYHPDLLIFENYYFDFFSYFSKFERIENFYIKNYNIHKIKNYIILERKHID